MSRAARITIVILLATCIAVVAVPSASLDSLGAWLADRQLDWRTRSRSMRQHCGWRRLILCRELPAATGPLAPEADSALVGVSELMCSRWPMTDYWGEACNATKHDTALNVFFAPTGRVLGIDRIWSPPQPGFAYEVLRQSLASQFGPGHECPATDDRATTQHRRWQLGSYSRGIHLLMGLTLVLDVSLRELAPSC